MGETVKVLDGVIEVRTEAKLPDPLPRPLALSAKVSFQACSTSACLLPAALVLSWPASQEASHDK